MEALAHTVTVKLSERQLALLRGLPGGSDAARLRNALEATADAEARIAQLGTSLANMREQRDHEAWLHAACATIAMTSESFPQPPSMAIEAVLHLRAERNMLRDLCNVQEKKILDLLCPPPVLDFSGNDIAAAAPVDDDPMAVWDRRFARWSAAWALLVARLKRVFKRG